MYLLQSSAFWAGRELDILLGTKAFLCSIFPSTLWPLSKLPEHLKKVRLQSLSPAYCADQLCTIGTACGLVWCCIADCWLDNKGGLPGLIRNSVHVASTRGKKPMYNEATWSGFCFQVWTEGVTCGSLSLVLLGVRGRMIYDLFLKLDQFLKLDTITCFSSLAVSQFGVSFLFYPIEKSLPLLLGFGNYRNVYFLSLFGPLAQNLLLKAHKKILGSYTTFACCLFAKIAWLNLGASWFSSQIFSLRWQKE